MTTNQELINSEQFENALSEGAECKKELTAVYKTQNKSNFQRFSEVMFDSNEEVKKILETKKKNRTDSDNKILNDFKQEIRQIYNQTQILQVKEKLEDNEKSRIDKIVDRVVPVITLLKYLDDNRLQDAFEKRGIKLEFSDISNKYSKLAADDKKKVLKDIFLNASNLKQKVLDENEHINIDIFQSKVPVDLQYDKKSNNSGLKQSDWKKLVDMKAKLLEATTEEAKEKVDEKIEHIASEKQFEVARAELVRDKFSTLQ